MIKDGNDIRFGFTPTVQVIFKDITLTYRQGWANDSNEYVLLET